MAYGDQPGDDTIPGREDLNEHRSIEDDAQRVKCRHCGAPAGQRCTNPVTGKPLRHVAVHTGRITDAKATPRLQVIASTADEEVPF